MIYTYDQNVDISQQDIGKKATAFLCILHYKYWCKSEKEKEEIEMILKHNEEEKRKKFLDYDRMFRQNEERVDDQIKNAKEENSVKVVTNVDKWYSKIWNFVHNIFKRK